MSYKEGDKVRVRSDVSIGEAVDDTQIPWSETQQSLAGQLVTISQVITGKKTNGDLFNIYMVKESSVAEGRSEKFFSDSGPTQQYDDDPFSDMGIDENQINDELPQTATSIRYSKEDPKDIVVKKLKERRSEYKDRIKDDDTLWELFFSKLEDTLRIHL